MPFNVSQQVLAFHPVARELRTGTLLTTYADQYHVQFHNIELGVHCLPDTVLIPISTNDFFMTTCGDSLSGPEVIVPGLEHLESVDFERTTYTDDNLQAMSLLVMFAER